MKSAKELVREQWPRAADMTLYSSVTEQLLWDALTLSEQERGYFVPITDMIRHAWASVRREDIRVDITRRFAGDDSAHV